MKHVIKQDTEYDGEVRIEIAVPSWCWTHRKNPISYKFKFSSTSTRLIIQSFLLETILLNRIQNLMVKWEWMMQSFRELRCASTSWALVHKSSNPLKVLGRSIDDKSFLKLFMHILRSSCRVNFWGQGLATLQWMLNLQRKFHLI